MKIFKRILIIVALLIGVAVIIGLLLPREQHVERSLVVEASPAVVFEQVNNLKNWENWSPWIKLDPASVRNYSDPAVGAGAYYTWSSENKNVGKGKMTILESQPNTLVSTELEFEGMEKARGYFKFEPDGNGTKVTWAFDANMGSNPFFRIMGLMMDKMLGKNFDEGLQAIKKAAEAAPEAVSPPEVAEPDSMIMEVLE